MITYRKGLRGLGTRGAQSFSKMVYKDFFHGVIQVGGCVGCMQIKKGGINYGALPVSGTSGLGW